MEIFHFGGPPQDKSEVLSRMRNAPTDVIFDRHPCISERVYGYIDGRRPKLTDTESDILLQLFDPLILYCNPGLEFLTKQLIYLKEKDHKSKEHVETVLRNYEGNFLRYEGLMNILSMSFKVVRINFNSTGLNEYLEEVISEYY